MNRILKIAIAIAYALTLFVFAAKFIGESFYESLVKEDAIIEYLSAIFLAFISLFILFRALRERKNRPTYWFLFQLFLAALFFFGFGEEISWGQRIFGIESSDFFVENNAQKETNLHNLVVNDTKINKIIFSQGLTIVMACYFLFSQLLYKRLGFVKSLVDKLSIPLPQMKQTIAFLVITILVAILSYHRIWEVWELAFGATLLWIFIEPKNDFEYEL